MVPVPDLISESRNGLLWFGFQLILENDDS